MRPRRTTGRRVVDLDEGVEPVRAPEPAGSVALADPVVTEEVLLPAPEVLEPPVEVVRTSRLRRLRPARRGGPSPWPVTSLRILALLTLGFVATVALFGPLRHARDQQLLFDQFRQQLAEGTAPVGQLNLEGQLLAPGAPVAVLSVPRIGIDEVVSEGTTSEVTRSGPGHLRSTVLPGQAGTSVILGRQAAYGGPFGRLSELRQGDEITVTTGQGEATYEVTGRRLPGDPLPPRLTAGQGRLTLVTASGAPYVPSEVLRVDAELTTPAQPAPPRALAAAALSPAEAPLAGDSDAWIGVVLLGQALLLAVAAVTWARLRWGRSQAWVVGVPLLGGLGLATADSIARLLPNLL
jgi:LPXTG-site transpeptidase (sortase) family protein